MSTPFQPGYVIDGRYELVKLLGAGAMGVVWRVFDREWSRDLAVKMPRPVVFESQLMRDHFVREAETWIGLHQRRGRPMWADYFRLLGK